MVIKSTPDEIRERFDGDVERFSNLDTGQVATIDSPVHLDLLTEAAAVTTPHARSVLDIGCGAGNYTLKLLGHLPEVEVTLLDLSRPMLDRAVERIGQVGSQRVHTVQGDVRDIDLGEGRFDIVMAAQCLHHLRGESQWRDVFAGIHRSLRRGGSFWVADSVTQVHGAVEAMMKRRWGDYLVGVKDEAYRDEVFAYVEKEDTPRPLAWQLRLMMEVGFTEVDILHKHSRFASFGGVRR